MRYCFEEYITDRNILEEGIKKAKWIWSLILAKHYRFYQVYKITPRYLFLLKYIYSNNKIYHAFSLYLLKLSYILSVNPKKNKPDNLEDEGGQIRVELPPCMLVSRGQVHVKMEKFIFLLIYASCQRRRFCTKLYNYIHIMAAFLTQWHIPSF